jgi:ppGpp synthetase/RelA/SpoT-type nucleotidyltranferase
MNRNGIGLIVGAALLGIIKKVSSGSKAKNVSITPWTKNLNATATYYPSFYLDSDGDGVNNVDDPKPFKWDSEGTTIEEVRLSEQLSKIIEYRNSMEAVRRNLEDVAKGLLSQESDEKNYVYGRTKTPYSIINKLRRTQLHKLQDLVGLTVVAETFQEVERVKNEVSSGALGKVVFFNDYYSRPMKGYRAFHFIIQYGNPKDRNSLSFRWEIQIKTSRQMLLGENSHEAYKRGKKNVWGVDFLSRIAHAADLGNEKAKRLFDIVAGNEEMMRSFIYTGEDITVPNEIGGLSIEEIEKSVLN